ncbi:MULTISPECIES: RodZ domain-containing protein [Methylotenera]|uniref:RodZ domain-containing protein n=1 Tax=Methylotenera TaxID=359407 RepID=UPI00036291A3|nr:MULTISPECIES: RodZ family helix-turn-helix domain-containing protein [Methylotenera]
MARKNTDNDEAKKTVELENVNTITASATDANQSDAYSRSRCGGALRIAREKQGLSLNDVASKLKISNKQIEAIEADNFSALPESTIVRGFIRNYAKLLKLEADPLLDAYNVLVPSKQPLAFMLKPSSTMKVTGYKKPKTGRYIALVVLFILAIAAWLFYQHYIEKPSPTVPTANADKLESLPQQALPAAERTEQPAEIAPAGDVAPSTEITLPPPASGDVSGVNQTPATTSSNPTPTQPVANTSATASAQLVLNPATPVNAPVADVGLIHLEFAASQETWVSVTDASGKQIYNKIIFAGSRQTVEAKPPLDLVFGNAAGASLMVNGKSVDLAPHTRVNVARLKLE